MKSPFPGMDPYLERHWEDVHTRLIGYIADTLQPQLSEDLIARMEEKVYVEDGSSRRLRKPDVRVVELPFDGEAEPGGVATAVLDEPILLELVGDPIRHRSVLIYDADRNRIITAIEVLSPWNKSPGGAMNEYLEKRKKYVGSDINLIEIDLIRAGDWTDMIAPYFVPPERVTTYRVTVDCPWERGLLLYPISIRSRLPAIKVPLRQHDTPAKLNLQELIEKAYAMGRYDRIDYSRPCVPPFDEREEQWAQGVLREARKR